MEEKGKAVTIESDEEEEGSLIYVEEMELDEEGATNIQPVRQPKYVPPSKGKAKVPTNMDDVDNILITMSLPKEVPFEGTMTSRISTMKFEYWDLADTDKFPHLVTNKLMKKSVEGAVTTLQPRKWLQKVEEVGLLCLLSIPHFQRPLITILIIRQLLCLVHDRYLWINKPIPITTELIHKITQLPCEGRDPMEIVAMSGDVTMTETLKKKYNLEKKQQGYAIDSILNKGVHVAT